MRRYFRLMLPVLMIQSIHYLCARLDLFGKSTLNYLKNKTFGDLLWAGILETWWGGHSIMHQTWTLSIEFWGSFFIYLVALTAHNYKYRFFFYTAIITFFYSMTYIGFLNLTYYKVEFGSIPSQLPLFVFGAALADMEMMVKRPLDKLRNLHWGYKIPVELSLCAMFLIWGSASYWSDSESQSRCVTKYDGRCEIYIWASWDGFLP